MDDTISEKGAKTLRFFGDHVIRYNTGAYMVSKNPYFLWQVYKGCRTAKREIPEWVLKYLDSVARKLAAGDRPHTALNLTRDASKHFRMKDKTADRLDTYHRHFKLADSGDMSENQIIDQLAADKNVSQKTIWNHLKDINDALESNPAS